ncbi:unnamed protein product [Dimorphilus gyrociliatus]|uniref:Uncharacterized protein n=1 Tax=Dimorphilus gyrociliatus TaxID=2664684 RepID=A0A7I8V8M2_9ANNE|nr:unnamed protein product [Dimorphilus gyrociliatus]
MKNYFLNNLGFNLNDEEMADISHPKAELITHITLKTSQLFSIVGTLIFHPVRQMVKKDLCPRNFVIKGARTGAKGAAIGAVAGTILSLVVIEKKKLEHDGLYDRAYRLRHNRGQVLVDQASVGLATVGAIGGTVMGKGMVVPGVWGLVGGVCGAAAYNNFIRKK